MGAMDLATKKEGRRSSMLLKEYPGKSVPFTADGVTREVAYVTRVDPLSGEVAKISLERARRQIAISTELNILPVAKCDFCNYQASTPKERHMHSCGAVSVPNKYPWEKYDWITIYPPFGEHKLLLSDLYFDDLERMVESSYDLAQICSRDPDVLAFMDFTNWGAFAGASQQHPHSQRKGLTGACSPRVQNELQRCREIWDRTGCNPFDLLEEEERRDGRRIIYENDILILASFAPSSPDEIIIFPREPIANILQTTEKERHKMVCPALGLFSALFLYRGVTDLNIAVHMAPFAIMEEARDYYRWHMHIYPRRAKLPADKAGAEIGFDVNVIDTLPEVTAQVLRHWYQEGPQLERVARGADGTPVPKLVQEFLRFRGVHAC